MTASAARPTQSETTAAANTFVQGHLAAATALGDRLAEMAFEPDTFLVALRSGLAELADPVAVDGMRSIAPGIGPVLGVRLPLLEAAQRRFGAGTKRTSTAILLDVTERLLRDETSEIRWFGMWDFERLLATDPERTWQLMRRAAREAGEWITVDTLAHPYGAGILREPRRWSELGGLIYSPSRWERRLVGSTLATLPHVRLTGGGSPTAGPDYSPRNAARYGGRDRAVIERGLDLVGLLIGDNEPDVQKALSWALRNFASIDAAPVAAFIDRESETARRDSDGNRAWVIRDSLSKLPNATAEQFRARLEGIRRRSDAPSTSRAAATAAEFAQTDAGAVPPPFHTPLEA